VQNVGKQLITSLSGTFGRAQSAQSEAKTHSGAITGLRFGFRLEQEWERSGRSKWSEPGQ